jgi:hypothetical protein
MKRVERRFSIGLDYGTNSVHAITVSWSCLPLISFSLEPILRLKNEHAISYRSLRVPRAKDQIA